MKVNDYWKTAFFIDSRLSKAGIDYSVIKCYRSQEFCDGNIDLVVAGSLHDFYEKNLRDKFHLKNRDVVKAKYYERNKLMCTSRNGEYISVHLHSNVGWHDLEFFSFDRIMSDSERMSFPGGEVVVCQRQFEEEILFLHAFFEKHKFSDLDIEFISEQRFIRLLSQYIDGQISKDWISERKSIPLRKLIKIWFSYYKKNQLTTGKNLFFHLMLLIRQLFQSK